MNSLLFSFFLLGLSLGVGPCMASCGPLLLSFISAGGKNVTGSIGAYLLFSSSRILAYVALAILIFLFSNLLYLHSYEVFSNYIVKIGGIFIIIIGFLLCLGKAFNNKMCDKLHHIFIKRDGKTLFIFGLIIGIMPCLPYFSMLSYVGITAKNILESAMLGFSFGLGTVISPVFILVIFAGCLPRLLKHAGRLIRVFQFSCGIIIIFLGLKLILRGAV